MFRSLCNALLWPLNAGLNRFGFYFSFGSDPALDNIARHSAELHTCSGDLDCPHCID